MLDRGRIQNSLRPFASPVVLSGKEKWHLEIVYCLYGVEQENSEEQVPNSLIDEMIDDRHQLRMHYEDEFKIAFKGIRTHIGHYEFWVMPFGLSNTTAS